MASRRARAGKAPARTIGMLRDMAGKLDEVVDLQIQHNNPPELRMTLNRLMTEGFTEGQARGLLARANFVELLRSAEADEPFNEARYVENLFALPLPHDIEMRDAARE